MTAQDRIALQRAHGVVFHPLPNLLGDVGGVYAARIVPGYVDAVALRGEGCAVAARARNSFSFADPFRRAAVMWSKLGTVCRGGRRRSLLGRRPGKPATERNRPSRSLF